MRQLLDRNYPDFVNAHGFDTVRDYIKSEYCGPACEWCGPLVGIAIVTTLDHIGDVYADASDVMLRDGEWIVTAIDRDAPHGMRELARYPQDKVIGIRNLPEHTRWYGHTVYDGPELAHKEAELG